ncbi:MAG: DUF4233 domain-containing protein [Actinomycetales bacterium]|nr:DUF4233 domain-containing protein [Actinomycetales bacterium]
MRVLCSSVLAMEAVVVLLATSLATSSGSVSNTALAWTLGLLLVLLLALAPATLRFRRGLTVGWILQLLVMASAIVVGWAMLVIGGIFVVLWWLAIQNGSRVDRLRAEAAATEAEPPSSAAP